MQQIIVSDMTLWSIRVVAFVFGAIWGSFFNVAIYRWPRELSVVTPASHCTACGKPIPAYLNLPIVGFFLLRGRTACCGEKLSPRYVVVEIIGAILCVAVVERFLIHARPATPIIDAVILSLAYFAFAGGLVIITFIDLEFMEIPDEVSLPLTAFGLVTAAFRDAPGVEAAALGAGGSYLIIQLVFVWSYERLTGRRGMGEGDSKLLMMIGAFVGWQGALFSLMAGALQGLVVVIVGFALGRRFTTAQMPTDGGEPEVSVHAPESSAANSPVKSSAPAGPARIVLAVHDEPDRGRKPVLRDELAAVVTQGQYPRELLQPEQEQENDEVTDSREPERDRFNEPQPRYVGHHKIPFGPFLALSALEYLFFGERIVNAYFSLF